MMSLTFGLLTQVSGSGPLGPLVTKVTIKVTSCLLPCVFLYFYTVGQFCEVIFVSRMFCYHFHKRE